MGCIGGKVADKFASAPAKSKEVEAAAVRPAEGTFTVTLERKTDSEEAGIKVEYPDEKVLRVTFVKEEGLIVDWNMTQKADSEQRIKIGDLIVAVNDECKNAEKMIQAFKKVGKITLTVQRTVVAADEPLAAPEPQSADSEMPTQEACKAEASKSEQPQVQDITAESIAEAAATQQSQGPDAIVEVANADGAAAAKPTGNSEKGNQPEEQQAKQTQRSPEDVVDSVVVEPEAAEANGRTTKTCGCF